MPEAPCALGSGKALLLGAVTHGAVSLSAALPAAKGGLVATLVTDPYALESLGESASMGTGGVQGEKCCSCVRGATPQFAWVCALLCAAAWRLGSPGACARLDL